MALSMVRRCRAAAFVAISCMCLAATTAELNSHYRFFPAGNFPGAYYSVPLGVSLTHIVGYYVSSTASDAYVQTGKSFRDAAPRGSFTSYLTAINGHGVAVGGYCGTGGGCNPEAGEHGYTYDFRSKRVRKIDYPGKGIATTAYGINDAGVIVGGYCFDNVCPGGAFSPTNHGFVDDHGHFTTLDFPNAQLTTDFAINDSGAITGFYVINNTGPHAFLYENGVFTTIDFPGSGYTYAYGINNAGVVSGLFADSRGAVHGFIYSKGQFAQIDVPGKSATQVTGINDHNELVGYWISGTKSRNFKAIPISPTP